MSITLASGTHAPTRTTMIQIIVGDEVLYFRHLGVSPVIGGRHFSQPKADLRFASRQEEKRFENLSTNLSDWLNLTVTEGDDAKDEALNFARMAANPAVASAIRSLFFNH